jgi:hypothetical protein
MKYDGGEADLGLPKENWYKNNQFYHYQID